MRFFSPHQRVCFEIMLSSNLLLRFHTYGTRTHAPLRRIACAGRGRPVLTTCIPFWLLLLSCPCRLHAASLDKREVAEGPEQLPLLAANEGEKNATSLGLGQSSAVAGGGGGGAAPAPGGGRAPGEEPPADAATKRQESSTVATAASASASVPATAAAAEGVSTPPMAETLAEVYLCSYTFCFGGLRMCVCVVVSNFPCKFCR